MRAYFAPSSCLVNFPRCNNGNLAKRFLLWSRLNLRNVLPAIDASDGRGLFPAGPAISGKKGQHQLPVWFQHVPAFPGQQFQQNSKDLRRIGRRE